jgi:hypothetical protein
MFSVLVKTKTHMIILILIKAIGHHEISLLSKCKSNAYLIDVIIKLNL